jgi:hypothetical protein
VLAVKVSECGRCGTAHFPAHPTRSVPLLNVADRITLYTQGLKAASVGWSRGRLTTGSSGRFYAYRPASQ